MLANILHIVLSDVFSGYLIALVCGMVLHKMKLEKEPIKQEEHGNGLVLDSVTLSFLQEGSFSLCSCLEM